MQTTKKTPDTPKVPKVSFQYRDILRAAKRTKTQLSPGTLDYCVVGVIVKDNYGREDSRSVYDDRQKLESKLSTNDLAKLLLVENGFEGEPDGRYTYDKSTWSGNDIPGTLSMRERKRYYNIGQKVRQYAEANRFKGIDDYI